MKKILITSNHSLYPLESGGQKAIQSLILQLNKEYKVYTFSPDLKKENSLLMNSEVSRFFGIPWFFKVIHYIKKERIDCIIVNYPWMGLLFFFVSCITKTTLIVYEHNIEYRRMRETKKWWWPILFPLEYIVSHVADEVWYISNDDLQQAKKDFCLPNEKLKYFPFVVQNNDFNSNGRGEARKKLQQIYCISEDIKIILFVGALDYYPNVEAVNVIVNDIYSGLLEKGDNFVILICGKNPPQEYIGKYSKILFTGFVDDITLYFKGCDLFINPILSGGGVKTKLVEALACGAKCISTKKGAEGLAKDDYENLLLTKNNDRSMFIAMIMHDNE